MALVYRPPLVIGADGCPQNLQNTDALGGVDFGQTTIADKAYTVLASDRYVACTALTATRNVTLPAASTYPTGRALTIIDEAGACSATVALNILAAGPDKINGAASAVLAYAYAYIALQSDGVSKWTIVDQSSLGMAQQAPGAVAITGGSINGTAVGASNPSTGAFTTLSASGAATIGGQATATQFSATGTTAQFIANDRTATGFGVFYRSGGINRLWDSSYGDVLTWNGSGAVSLLNTFSVSGTSTFGAQAVLAAGSAGGLKIVNGSSTTQIYDDTNGHLESTSTLWLNGNGAYDVRVAAGGGQTYLGKAGVLVNVVGTLSCQGSASFLVSPTAPTPAAGDSSTRLATTAFVASGFMPSTTAAAKTSYRAPGTDLLGLPNGNFEDGLAGWSTNLSGTGVVAIDASNSLTGTNSVKLTVTAINNSDQAGIASPLFPCGASVSPNPITMLVGVRVKLNTGSPQIGVNVNFYTANKTFSTYAYFGAWAPGSAWAEKTFVVDPPAGAYYASVYAYVTNSAVGSAWLDEVRVCRDYAYVDPTSNVQRGLMARERETLWVKDFGVVGDGTTDDTNAMQAAINAATTGGRLLRISDDIVIKVTSTLTASGPLRMEGSGSNPFSTSASYPSNTRGRGSWLYFAHTGVGLSITGGAQYSSGCSLRRFGTIRNQPNVVSGQAWTPTANDYDIVVNSFDGVIEDVTPWNATSFLKVINGLHTTIDRIFGQCFNTCIFVQNAYDVTRITNVHMWQFWSLATEVQTYQISNLNVITLGRVDTPYIDEIFGIYGYALLRFSAYTTDSTQANNGCCNKGQIGRIDGDFFTYLVLCDGTTSNASGSWPAPTAAILNGCCHGEQTTAVANHLINVTSSGARLDFGILQLNNAKGSLIQAAGAGTRVIVADLVEGTFNGKNGGYAAVVGTGGGSVEVKSWRPGAATEQAFSIYPANNNNAPRAQGSVQAELSRGFAQGTTAADGSLIIAHYAGQQPTAIEFSCPSVSGANAPICSLVALTATTFTLKFFDLQGSGGLTVMASKTVTVPWHAVSTYGP